ncbi:MAG: glycine cleavage system aminomethyltransferase GcvT [Chloroflexi bacterium]|nr:glycine cleavage system aminomethyltransferase GcvT [Chloroflexota bacterium]
MTTKDFLFRGSLRELDPDVYELIQLEAERQYRKLILIASESTAPGAVLEALGSRFQNIYAEGYPDDETRWMTEREILDYEARLGHYRRYADPRYYKGVEYADTIEALARRRCAEIFAANGVTADQICVNVQALSGGPANNAVYHALVNPGDTVMGMNLLYGGHLSHGSPVNRSGKYYKIVPYTINAETERIDMDEVERLAREHKPKMIIVGYSSYPWAADFERFRAIADSVGAYLMADMVHVAGLIAGGVYPSPIGRAHVVTFTTHKTLNGPRGACILTTDLALAKKIDRAVFPGEQGGPHVNVFAALALAFKIAATPEYRELQAQTVKNCVRFADQMKAHGFRIPFGGTESHLFNLDCKSVTGSDGTPLMGDMAARILDIAGVVVNRNTIPGDKSAANPSGLRLGTPWISQRGFKEEHVDKLAAYIAQVLKACRPYKYEGRRSDQFRAKVDFDALNDAKVKVRDLAQSVGIDFTPPRHDYPHFYYVDDGAPQGDAQIEIEGDRAEEFLNWATANDVYALKDEESQASELNAGGKAHSGVLTRVDRRRFIFSLPSASYTPVKTWLRDLSDGYVAFDDDLFRKLPGPIAVRDGKAAPMPKVSGGAVSADKPYFIGVSSLRSSVVSRQSTLPQFEWKEPTDAPLKKTRLNETHRALGGRMVPFAGWEMPVQYTGVLEEHQATRRAAGLFDVSHMGAWDATGPGACAFLDAVTTNEVASLKPGESMYSQFLAPNGHVLDDCYIYQLADDHYLIVVNASNDDKDWAWVNAVQRGEVTIDEEQPRATAPGRHSATLRNLRAESSGAEMRVDIALQGPKSREILLALGSDANSQFQISKLKRTELCRATVGGFDLIVARTGYTGEQMGFELFVHPERAVDLWNALMKAGAPLGLKPCGLASRDSLRTEAGLPLYGDEMAGHLDLGVGDAGFGSYVKVHKPWFVGRKAFVEQEKKRKSEVARFRFNAKAGRMAHNGDPVLDDKGRVIGEVTCCSIDAEGFRLGQAYIELKYGKEGTPLAIMQGAGEAFAKAGSKPATQAELEAVVTANGDKVRPLEAATVMSRFPKKK